MLILEHRAVSSTPFRFKSVGVPHDHVACDGGGGALGHPIEYMTLGEKGEVICKYCGRRYLAVDHPEADTVRREPS